jgi:CRISPR-associated protein Cas1
MIKRTLYFGNPCYLFSKDKQLYIKLNENTKPSESVFDNLKYKIPIEDIGLVILDNYGITMSQYLLSSLLENNVAVVVCNSSHMPNGMFLNLDSNTLQSKLFTFQINASKPLKNQLWQQTVSAKISNQSRLLKLRGIKSDNMDKWIKDVVSGDRKNVEAKAAVFYWKNLFLDKNDFYRDRFGPPPNNLLNYGYAILRAITARSISGSGLLPTLGIHHSNKYNSYCLADDIMEPYRPFVDKIICDIIDLNSGDIELNPDTKVKLLEISTSDVFISGERSPLSIAMQRTTSSLSKCYEGTSRKIIFPEFCDIDLLKKKRKHY